MNGEFENETSSGQPVAVNINDFIEHDQGIDGLSGIGQVSIVSAASEIVQTGSGEMSLEGLYGALFPLYDVFPRCFSGDEAT